jgi:hypothetical protein
MSTRATAWALAVLAFQLEVFGLVSWLLGRPTCPAVILWMLGADLVARFTWYWFGP